ncbi:MAG: amidase [Proteobacteria bacterium]|nr:amidase [Pseudomonadota bacterium]
MKGINELDATAQAELVKKGEVSSLELVDTAIARIEEINPKINAVIHTHFDRARKQAQSDLPDGPFKGVPFLLKDLGNGNLKGDPIYWGTRFLKEAGFRADSSAYLVEKFLAAGLVVVGRTNVPELGAWTTTEPESYGPSRNPWNLNHSTGGSSGGSAAAVAAQMVPMAHASDGGGSIRNPASQCGVVGLKPTRGRISLGPDIGESWAGLVFEFAETRTVRDAAALLDCVQGAMPGDPYVAVPPSNPYRDEVGRDPGKLKVGFLKEIPGVDVKTPISSAVESVAKVLADLGHGVEESWPKPMDAAETEDFLESHIIHIIASYQAHSVDLFGKKIGREIGPEDMDCDNWAVTELGRTVTASQYLDAVDAIHRFDRQMAGWWEGGYDLLVTPTIPEPPPPLGELVPDKNEPLKGFMRSGLLIPFLIPFNMTGQPAISLPLCRTDDGLPIGIQLVAAFGREDLLFRIASQMETAMPWADRKPQI